MADFSFLQQYDVGADARAEYTCYQITGLDGGPIVLEVAPAGEPNKPYFTALTRYAMKNQRRMRGNPNIIDDTRKLDRELYPQFVVKGWRNVPDTAGNEVPFSAKRAAEFLALLPAQIFDDLREFCADLDNYSAVTPDDVDDTAKNSESGFSSNSE